MDIRSISNGFRVWTTGGTPFTPLNGEIVNTELFSLFDFTFQGDVYSADGIGADTLGIIGVALTGTGLYDGFNDIALKLITGGVVDGETLCIDSSFYGVTGQWIWATASGDIFPTWSGQQCFTAMCPACIGAVFTNCVDTLRSTDCSTISYQFEADDPLNIPPGNILFSIIDGPGTIDSVTGDWSYNIPPNKLGTYENLRIETYGSGCPCWTNECMVILDYTSNVPADFNSDCSTNISDLVFFIAYMFSSGTPPTPLMSADMNGDSKINVSDLVYLISYMFNSGPPPVG